MKQLIATFFSIALLTIGNVRATQSTNASIRCSTNHNNGNFSVFVGTISKDELKGHLTRGLNHNFGQVHETFEIFAEMTSPTDDGIFSFQLNSDLFLSAPLDFLGWEKSTFTVDKFLLTTHKGGMLESGNFLEDNQELPYRYQYKCVAL
ncbi:MAG TPA: hypothetical protein VI911_05855 [Patescibacteria group bacterium]|nr:hypothetical protein [Patescibacteria group bacterium]